jgi:competence protein ComGC
MHQKVHENLKPMKTTSTKHRARAFTIWDLLIVLVTVALLILFLPMFPRHRSRVGGAKISCVNNLRQIGLAFRVWSNDHGERFPMTVSTNKGGSLEFTSSGEVFRHFRVISNELNNIQLLICPADLTRLRGTNFATLNNSNLSYFLGLDADATHPQMILAGDRNITTNGRLMSGLLTLPSGRPLRWTKDIHGHCGNIGLADGSAQQLTDSTLTRETSGNASLPVRMEIP